MDNIRQFFVNEEGFHEIATVAFLAPPDTTAEMAREMLRSIKDEIPTSVRLFDDAHVVTVSGDVVLSSERLKNVAVVALYGER